jgi:MarR family transcriptional regulator, negative regulator of the multidrug operon emrRAB
MHDGRMDLPRLENLAGAFALSTGRRLERAVEEATGLGPAEAAALVALRNFADGGRQDLLRDALELSQPGVVRVVDRLVQRGLVERRRGAAADRREVQVAMTGAGREAVATALDARAEVLDRALAPLADGDRRRLEALLERLLAASTTDRASARSICRLCDGPACGHPDRCPVTQAVA